LDRPAGRSGPGIDGTAYPDTPRGAGSAAPIGGREDRSDWESHVSTRTLILLAAITGLAILAAGAIQILLAR
jgi:hypothetical protein